jgi:hypothetical protein
MLECDKFRGISSAVIEAYFLEDLTAWSSCYSHLRAVIDWYVIVLLKILKLGLF